MKGQIVYGSARSGKFHPARAAKIVHDVRCIAARCWEHCQSIVSRLGQQRWRKHAVDEREAALAPPGDLSPGQDVTTLALLRQRLPGLDPFPRAHQPRALGLECRTIR